MPKFFPGIIRNLKTTFAYGLRSRRLGPHLHSDAAHCLRFLEEAERASRLSDSHVATIHDVLEERGEIFLVMDYVEGQNLRERLRRQMNLKQFLASSFVATSDRIRHETPTPIHIFNPKVPQQLEKLASKAMAKEPGQRHASARELLQDLRVVQAGVTPVKRVLPRKAKRPPKRWLTQI